MNIHTLWYRFRHSFFRWKSDADGDLTFRLAWILHFTKYKEHTVVRLRHPSAMQDAHKWQGYSDPESAP